MEDYLEVFEYDNSEPEDAWWNEQDGYETSYQDAWDDAETDQESPVLEEILEALSSTQSYGTMGDYYNMELGCYVFPGYEVYAYFIDIDAVGHEWAEAYDGHWLPVLYLEKYEAYISGEEDGEETEPEEDAPVEVLPTETDLQNLETLESVRGLLSVIKENNTAFYQDVREYQSEALILQQQTASLTEGILYCGITECILTGLIAGSFVAHTFFERMRAG